MSSPMLPHSPVQFRPTSRTYIKPLPRRGYSRFLVLLFLIMAAYLVLPIIDVPFMGLSLSAPIFFVIALNVLLKPTEPWVHKFRGWILLTLFIWLGVFISVMGNGLLSAGTDIDSVGMIYIIRFAYWLLLFVVTAYLSSYQNIMDRVTQVLGWGVFGLALMRLFEAVAWGRIGSEFQPRLMTQNGYGFLFSVFFPFLLAPIITTKGVNRAFMILRLPIGVAAVLINGSRSSWVTVMVGIFVFSAIFFLAKPRKLGWSLAIMIFSAIALLMIQYASYQVTAAFDQRFATFENLETDKSWAVRKLMIQKGVRLFQESPLIGVGISRFTKESTYLDIPSTLSYSSQSYFDVKSAHNSYIAFLAEAGLVGSLPFAALLIILAIRGLRSSLSLARRGYIRVIGVYAAFLGMSIHMWSINAMNSSVTWFIYGLVAAVIMVANRPDE